MIYFVHATGTDHVKIGYTGGDPAKRLETLQTGCPNKLKILATVAGDEKDEKAWHQRFAADRVKGEWFVLTPRLMAAVCAAKAVTVSPSPKRGGKKTDKPAAPVKLYAIVFGEDGLIQFTGEVMSETAEHIRVNLHDGLMMWAGVACPSGEIRDVCRDRVRLFCDVEGFGDAVSLSQRHLDRHMAAAPARTDPVGELVIESLEGLRPKPR